MTIETIFAIFSFPAYSDGKKYKFVQHEYEVTKVIIQ